LIDNSQGGKLLRVDPRNTSRECNACHHISSENRLSQESFRCGKKHRRKGRMGPDCLLLARRQNPRP